MKLLHPSSFRRDRASVLIVVLWICIGLVSITLYFANSMTYELQAADNRVNGMSADQTIEGAARYISYTLSNYATNGAIPDNTKYSCANIAVGNAHFWIIGRDPSGTPSSEPYFGLIDEGSKLNLNRVGTNTLSYLPNMDNNYDLAQTIINWRNTNASPDLSYAQYGYTEKEAPFETVDELRLIDGATEELLLGDDLNRNGVLDANEKDIAGTGKVEPGLLEYLTVYSREPNYHSDGSALTNVNTASQESLESLFQDGNLSNPSGLATSVYGYLHPRGAARTFASALGFYLYLNNLGTTSSQFAMIYDNVTMTASTPGTYIRGRLNINTASEDVMTALFMGSGLDQNTAESAAQTLVTYRDQNPTDISSPAWIVDALGKSSPVVTALAARDVITTHSYQFTADIAAVGSLGRGYRRVKFIFDVSEGYPKILYRQDLSRLGWALGKKARQDSLAVNATK